MTELDEALMVLEEAGMLDYTNGKITHKVLQANIKKIREIHESPLWKALNE